MDKIKAFFLRLSDSIKSFYTGRVTPFAKKTAVSAAELWNGKVRPTAVKVIDGAKEFFRKPKNLIICCGVAAAVILATVFTLLYVNLWSWVDNVTVIMPADVYAASVATPSDAPSVSDSDSVSASDAVSGSDAVSDGDIAPETDAVSGSDAVVSGSDVASSSDIVEEQPETVSAVVRMKKGSTVADALAQLNVTLDKSLSIDTPLETELEKDMVISIYRMKLVSIIVDGKRVNHYTEALTVGDVLRECDVTLGEQDRISCILQTGVTNNMTVEISRVAVVDEVRSEPVPYTTEKRENSNVLAGQTSVITAGVDGTKDVTYRCTYVDGILESEEIVGEVITLEPVTEVIEVGTKRTTTTTRRTTAGRYIVSKEKVYDCDGSGHGYYIITYSDGTVVYKDF